MRFKSHIFDKVDWWTVLMYAVLVIIGWLNIYAALYNENYELMDFSQKVWATINLDIDSLLIAIFILFFNWKFFEGFAYLIYVLSLLSLIGVLLFGIEVNGAKSWFDFSSCEYNLLNLLRWLVV